MQREFNSTPIIYTYEVKVIAKTVLPRTDWGYVT